jgi:FkbM family methyltransferase
MPAEAPDFRAVAPTPPARWKVRLVSVAARYSPYRIPRVRRRVLKRWRARKRARRLLAEARGDRSLSSPSLYGMADRLDRYLNFDGGFFVEAGANDGFDQSNTYHLERFRGWRGLLVEAVPELYEEILLDRPRSHAVNCALVGFDHPGGPVEIRYGGLRSVVAGTHGSEQADREWVGPAFDLGLESEYVVSVAARTLTSVLDEIDAPEVDLLSLDVEGFEPEVLRGLDFERHAPRFILVEITDPARRRAAIDAVLGDRYVEVEQLSPFDWLFARADQPVASTRS